MSQSRISDSNFHQHAKLYQKLIRSIKLLIKYICKTTTNNIEAIRGKPRTKIHDSGNGQFEFDEVKIV